MDNDEFAVVPTNGRGYGPSGRWRLVNRWLHTLLGVLLALVVFLTYLVTPPDTLF
ncbi:hypothetical protein [Halovivax ruber]|uniref:hypothetical protein n=1 Tax=Halovivax ruber TaxID=387341 RepID=UPI001494CF5A|nr:hypothetical protein [Halovivax ruber]